MEVIDYQGLSETRLTGLLRNNEHFKALLNIFTSTLTDYQNSYAGFYETFLNIDGSFGTALDVIGGIVGQPRELIDYSTKPYFGFEGARNAQTFGTLEDPDVGGFWRSIINPDSGSSRILTDEEYRRVIKARIVKNKSNVSRDSFLEVINLLTNNTQSTITDSRHGLVYLTIGADEGGLASYFLDRRRLPDTILPIPLGYRISVNFSVDVE